MSEKKENVKPTGSTSTGSTPTGSNPTGSNPTGSTPTVLTTNPPPPPKPTTEEATPPTPTTLTTTPPPVPKNEDEIKKDEPVKPLTPASQTPPAKTDPKKKKKGLWGRIKDAWRTKKPDADTHKEKKFDDFGSILKMLFDILFGAPKTLRGLGLEVLRLPLTIPLAIGSAIVSGVAKPLQVLGKAIGNETLLNNANKALNFAEGLRGDKHTHPEGEKKDKDETPPPTPPLNQDEKPKPDAPKPATPNKIEDSTKKDETPPTPPLNQDEKPEQNELKSETPKPSPETETPNLANRLSSAKSQLEQPTHTSDQQTQAPLALQRKDEKENVGREIPPVPKKDLPPTPNVVKPENENNPSGQKPTVPSKPNDPPKYH